MRLPRRLRLVIAGLLVSSLGACGAAQLSQTPPPPASVEKGLQTSAPPRPVQAQGEELVARAEVMGLSVAQMNLRLGAFCAQEEAESATISVETTFDTTGVGRWFKKVRGRAWTRLDERTGRARAYSLESFEGDLHRRYDVQLHKGKYHYQYSDSEGKTLRGKRALQEREVLHDFHSGFLLLRSWRAEPGEQSYFYVVLGRTPWRADVTWQGQEWLEHEGQKRRVIHIQGVAHRVGLKEGQSYTPRSFALWLTDDSLRLPLRVKAEGSSGSLTLHLEERRVHAGCMSPALFP